MVFEDKSTVQARSPAGIEEEMVTGRRSLTFRVASAAWIIKPLPPTLLLTTLSCSLQHHEKAMTLL